MSGYLEVMTAGAAALVVLAVIAVTVAWGLTRLGDRANVKAKGPWRTALNKIHDDSLACAVYYAGRWIGVCVLIGWLFSKPV